MNLSKLQEREKKSWTLKIFNCGHVYLEILSFSHSKKCQNEWYKLDACKPINAKVNGTN